MVLCSLQSLFLQHALLQVTMTHCLPLTHSWPRLGNGAGYKALNTIEVTIGMVFIKQRWNLLNCRVQKEPGMKLHLTGTLVDKNVIATTLWLWSWYWNSEPWLRAPWYISILFCKKIVNFIIFLALPQMVLAIPDCILEERKRLNTDYDGDRRYMQTFEWIPVLGMH